MHTQTMSNACHNEMECKHKIKTKLWNFYIVYLLFPFEILETQILNFSDLIIRYRVHTQLKELDLNFRYSKESKQKVLRLKHYYLNNTKKVS